LNEAKLRERLSLIEALFAGAGGEGERMAAAEARKRILKRLHDLEQEAPAVEFRFSMPDEWAHRLFTALVRRYDLKPYRYTGQKRTTVMIRAPKRFIDETLMPEFEALYTTLRSYLDEVTDRVVSEVLHPDRTDVQEMAKPTR
jgi:hypothetical protein